VVAAWLRLFPQLAGVDRLESPAEIEDSPVAGLATGKSADD